LETVIIKGLNKVKISFSLLSVGYILFIAIYVIFYLAQEMLV